MEHASEERMDATYVCCIMPEPENACDVAFIAEAFTCCDEVQVARDQSRHRVMPVSRYDASDLSHAALDVVTDFSIAALLVTRIVPMYPFSFIEDPSPPLRSLLCTYLI